MKNAPRKPMVSAIIAILVLISPIYAESASNLEKYLDCSSEKKIDIVFVFDTTNSMGGEISELRATANKFATDLEASNIDYQLGLVEFRDFPETCDGFSCGSAGDFAYSVKGNGTLTSEIDTFGTWLKELKAGGGGSPGPEAVLTALRHAGSDLSWRSDAEKAIIVLTDAGVHPDGSCCNAEGDTLEGTVYELVDIGARAYIIGPKDASLEKIAENTGGQFYEIRSGLSLKPLLEEITKSLGCSFRTDVETSCENNQLEVSVQLIGKETIPNISGQTEAWMYLDQAGSISRINPRYDQEAEAYVASVPDVCGPVELTVYGRAGERSAVQTVQVECDACGVAAEAEEQGALSISGRIYEDSNGDGVRGAEEVVLDGWEVFLLKPDGGSVAQQADRNGYYIFSGLLPGSYKVVANAQENWTAVSPETGTKDVELIDVHESEIDFGFRSKQIENQPDDAESNSFSNVFLGGQLWSVQPVSDGEYILAGQYNRIPPLAGFWLIKTDAEGNELWNKTYFNNSACFARSVLLTSDGGYILAGGNDDDDLNNVCGARIVKTDADGNQLWDKVFEESGDSMFNSVQLTSDGGYVLAGRTDYRIGERDAWLMKIDANGNEIWSKTFGSFLEGYISDKVAISDSAYSVLIASDGGYVLAGERGRGGAWLIKTDADGNELWNKTYRDDESAFYSIRPTVDGGYILAGKTGYSETSNHNYFRGVFDGWLVKTDADGNELWNRTFDLDDEYDSFNSIQLPADGGYVLAGSGGVWGGWLLKTDENGNELWNSTFRGEARSVQLTADGGYIFAGSIFDPEVKAWLCKTDANGN